MSSALMAAALAGRRLPGKTRPDCDRYAEYRRITPDIIRVQKSWARRWRHARG